MPKNNFFLGVLTALLFATRVHANSPTPTSVTHLDGLFGQTGLAQYNQGEVSIFPKALISAVLPDNRDLVFMSFETTPNRFSSPHVLLAVKPDGTLDQNFGAQSYVPLSFEVGPFIDLGSNETHNTKGSISLLANHQRIYVVNSVQQTLTIQGFTLDGLRDRAFMPSGHLILPDDSYHLLDAQLQADGKIVLAYTRSRSQQVESVLVRIAQDGQIDPTFANHQPLRFFNAYWDFKKLILNRQKIGYLVQDGIIWLSENGQKTGQFELMPYADLVCPSVGKMEMKALGDDGGFVAFVFCEQSRQFLLRFNANHQLDTKFGNQGVIESDLNLQNTQDVFLLSSGEILLATFGNDKLAFYKYRSNGQRDIHYPTNIITRAVGYFAFPYRHYTVRSNGEIRGLGHQTFATSIVVRDSPQSFYLYFHITPDGALSYKPVDLKLARNTFESVTTFSRVNKDGSSTILFGLDRLEFTGASYGSQLAAIFLTPTGALDQTSERQGAVVFSSGFQVYDDSLIALPNGKWLLHTEQNVMRLNADLSIDRSLPNLPISLQQDLRGEKIAAIQALPNNDYVMLTAQCVETGSGRWGEYCIKFAKRLYKFDQNNVLLAGKNREVVAFGQIYGNKIVVTAKGNLLVLDRYELSGGNLLVQRFHADLTPDPSFGINGFLVGPTTYPTVQLLVSEDERIFLLSVWQASNRSDCDSRQLRIAKYQPNGLSDLSYGKQGVVVLNGVDLTGKSDIKPDRSLILPIQTQCGDLNDKISNLYQDVSVLHLLPNGEPNLAWGNNGIYTLQGQRGRAASVHWLPHEGKQALVAATLLTGAAQDTVDVGVFKLVNTPSSTFKYQSWLPLVGKFK
ncbi:MAG: delta-60 repeat domain-containing protein [Anaerolineae bacterium]|nr:delta-60 repeat domain-containing protein [Anaerolineae bacterium]